MRSKLFAPAFFFGLILAAGCSKHGTLGAFEDGERLTIQEARVITNGAVSLYGRIVEKCPVAGCWFYLDDGTGRMKVDTKAAGFVVLDVPIGRKVEVRGKIDRSGDDTEIAADGVRY